MSGLLIALRARVRTPRLLMICLIWVVLLRGDTAGDAIQRGDYHKAIDLAARNQLLHRQTGDIRAEKEDIYAIGLSHLFLGDYEEAGAAFEHSLTLDRKTGDLQGEVIRLKDLGNVRFFEARYSESAKLYEEARGLLDANQAAPWYNHSLALVLANQAVLYQRIGQYEEALEIYSRFPSSLSPSEQARMLANKGTLFRRLGDPYRAIELFAQAEALFRKEHHSDGELGTLKNRGIALALDLDRPREAVAVFHEALALAAVTSNKREMLQAFLYRAEAFRRMGDLAASRADAEAALRISVELNSTEDQWKALYAVGRVSPARSLELYRRAVRIIEDEREGLELPALRRDFLGDKREVYDAAIALMVNGPVQPLFDMVESSRSRNLQDRLPRAHLAEIQRSLDSSTALIETWWSRQGHAVIWISKERAAVYRVQNTAEIALLPALNDVKITKLDVVPDGEFHAPFESLVLPDGRMLVEKAAVTYLPTAAYLLRRHNDRTWRFPWESAVLALAVPTEKSGLPELHYALDEAKTAASFSGGHSQVIAGTDVRADLLQAPRFALIHLAAHAVAGASSAESSRLMLADGPIYLRALYRWRLERVNLITLSSCSTESGKTMPGEGVENFSRALLLAGAGATVTSLWPVADEPTASFMNQFYYWLGKGNSKAEALQQAKLKFLKSRSTLSAPQYWAGFIVSGDGFSPVPRFITWPVFLSVTAALSAAILVSVISLKRRNNVLSSVDS